MDRPWTFGSNLTFGYRRGRASQAFPAQPRQTQGLQHECSSASRHSFDLCSTESHSLPPPSSAFTHPPQPFLIYESDRVMEGSRRCRL